MNTRPLGFVGIAVSKDQRDLACRPEDKRWHVANDSAGIADSSSNSASRSPH